MYMYLAKNEVCHSIVCTFTLQGRIQGRGQGGQGPHSPSSPSFIKNYKDQCTNTGNVVYTQANYMCMYVFSIRTQYWLYDIMYCISLTSV